MVLFTDFSFHNKKKSHWMCCCNSDWSGMNLQYNENFHFSFQLHFYLVIQHAKKCLNKCLFLRAILCYHHLENLLPQKNRLQPGVAGIKWHAACQHVNDFIVVRDLGLSSSPWLKMDHDPVQLFMFILKMGYK